MDFPVSTTVAATDKALYFAIWVSVFFTVLLTIIMVAFVIRYGRKRNPVPGRITSNIWLEILWTGIPTILVLMMFWYGYVGFSASQSAPSGSLQIQAEARMYAWTFSYPNKKESPVLYVPQGQAIDLKLVSKDVIHSFYVPAFRFKHDVVPGTDNRLTFTPLETGTFDIFCAEYCGVGHSAMNSSVVVMPPREFSAWYAKREEQRPVNVEQAVKPSPSEIQRGEEIYLTNCVVCHGPTGHGENLAGSRDLTSLAGWTRGAGIPAMFETLTEGLGAKMPAFANLPVEDRFAVLHYVRDKFLKNQGPVITAEEIRNLDSKYELAKGSLAPPELPVDQAKAILASQSTITLRLATVEDEGFSRLRWNRAMESDPEGGTLFAAQCARCHDPGIGAKRALLREQGYAPLLPVAPSLTAGNQAWQKNGEALRLRVRQSSMASGGYKPEFATLSTSQWEAILRFIRFLSDMPTSADDKKPVLGP